MKRSSAVSYLWHLCSSLHSILAAQAAYLHGQRLDQLRTSAHERHNTPIPHPNNQMCTLLCNYAYSLSLMILPHAGEGKALALSELLHSIWSCCRQVWIPSKFQKHEHKIASTTELLS